MSKSIQSFKLSDSITITECNDGWWLWDETRKMNLSMKADSKEAALFVALEYYQDRFNTLDTQHKDLKSKVESFVSGVISSEDHDCTDFYCNRCGSSSEIEYTGN